MAEFNFPKPFQFGKAEEQAPRPLIRDEPQDAPPTLVPRAEYSRGPPRADYSRGPPMAAFQSPYPPLQPARIAEVENIDHYMGMEIEDLLRDQNTQKIPENKPESYALPATFIERDENQERELAIKMQVLVDKLKEYKDMIKELRDKNLEISKTSYEKGQDIEHLKLEKNQLEEELKSLGLYDKRGYRGGGGLAIISRKALDDDESKRKLEMKRELMMGIALVEGDFADLLGKQESEKNMCERIIDQMWQFLYRLVILKGDMKRIEARYDKSISSYFSFYKFLVNSSIFMLAIFSYLLVSHILFYNGSLVSICTGGPCFLLYFGFSTSEGFAYSMSIIAFIFATVLASLVKWVRTDLVRKRAEIYGGKDVKLKKFAASVFNNWTWSINTETDSFDQSVNISNQLTTALKDEARLREASRRTAKQKTALTIRRIIGSSIYLFILCTGWVIIILILVSEDAFISAVAPSGILSLILGFIPKLGVSIVNAMFPALTITITALENWDDPSFIVKLQIIRMYIAKMLNVILFATLNLALATNRVLFNVGEEISYDSSYKCREDQAGINLLLLVVSETIMCKLIPLVMVLVNYIITKTKKETNWRKEIKVSQQLINLIYFQALVWVAIPYFPYVSVLAPIFMFLDFKFQHWRLNRLQIKPLQQTQASDLVIFIMRVYNITLLLAIAYLAYFLTAELSHLTYDTTELCGAFLDKEPPSNNVIDSMTSREGLSQFWNYVLGYAPVFWVLLTIAVSKVFFMRNHLKIMTQYQNDKEVELTHQIYDLQRANAILRKKEKLNKNLL